MSRGTSDKSALGALSHSATRDCSRGRIRTCEYPRFKRSNPCLHHRPKISHRFSILREFAYTLRVFVCSEVTPLLTRSQFAGSRGQELLTLVLEPAICRLGLLLRSGYMRARSSRSRTSALVGFLRSIRDHRHRPCEKTSVAANNTAPDLCSGRLSAAKH